jgi:hypothetical protein
VSRNDLEKETIMTTLGITAPDWRPGMPSKFERMGPAWVSIWAYLDYVSPDWRSTQEIALLPVVAQHDLAPRTIENMLREARQAGLLQVTYRKCGHPKVKRACYRRAIPSPAVPSGHPAPRTITP